MVKSNPKNSSYQETHNYQMVVRNNSCRDYFKPHMKHSEIGKAIPKAEVRNFIWAIAEGSYGYIYVLNARCHIFTMSTIRNT